MAWLTHRFLRKEASFKLVPNEQFNLESKTGIKAWNSPKFVISVNKYLSEYGAVDARCEIVEVVYPTFKLNNIGRIGSGSEITVYVVEGNKNTINYNPNANWTTTYTIKENTMYQFEINAGNNWTVPIPDNLIGKEFDILYLPKKISFTKTTFGYEYQAVKNPNNTISFKLQQTYGNIIRESFTNTGDLNATYYNCVYLIYYPKGRSSTTLPYVDVRFYINGTQYNTTIYQSYYQDYNMSRSYELGWYCKHPPVLSLDKNITITGHTLNSGNCNGEVMYATTSNYSKKYTTDFVSTVVFIKK